MKDLVAGIKFDNMQGALFIANEGLTQKQQDFVDVYNHDRISEERLKEAVRRIVHQCSRSANSALAELAGDVMEIFPSLRL